MTQFLLITRFPYSSEMGGTETFTRSLARAMRERGIQVSFMGRCVTLAELLEPDGFEVRTPYLPKSPVSIGSILLFTLLLPYSWIRSWFLIRSLPANTSLYCLSLTDKILFTSFAHRRGMKVVWGEHESLKDEKGGWRRWMKGNPFFGIIRRLSRYATVATVSPGLARQFTELGFSNVISIPNPLSPLYLEQSKEKAVSFPGKIVIGTASRLKREKGIREFLHLMPLLNAKYDNLHFLICGGGPLEGEVRNFIAKQSLTNITLLPHQKPEDMPSVYASMDITLFLANSPLETFGLAAIEAMSQGVPTLITPWFGLVEGKSEDPWILTDPADPRSTLTSLEPLIKDEQARKALGERQKDYILSTFAPEKSMARYADLFNGGTTA